MSEYKTPNKAQYLIKYGHVALHVKWKNSQLMNQMKETFTAVQLMDLKEIDVCLQDIEAVYLSRSELLLSFEASLKRASSASLIIADRNVETVGVFSKVQGHFLKSGISVLPVGNASEVALILHQLMITTSMSSPPSFKPMAKPDPHIRIKLLMNIPGLGEGKAEKLLSTFGTIQRIGSTSAENLAPVVGKAAALKIVKYFQHLH